MTGWEQGRAVIEQMLRAGDLGPVPADPHGAAALLADDDVALAYDALHAANRKALTALLLAQGLRPTRSGGHVAVHDAVRAQLHPPLGPRLAPYHRIRRTRNDGDCLDDTGAGPEDVRADLPLCEGIVDLAATVLPRLPVFAAPGR
ncbi:hypothetical protein [Cellulomonas triticagri]|uniref:HEPN domain-containing protein n=1 Tax=Cellulomonas triticagri TaxID=2483352 RepID=A0A3M2JRL3_9CELL|nr:hypothetical protein [Cellulomonas triticagri]RMI13345.1 hypothetical protein EBM89_04915 [Cellulomonas triticagri]